MDAEKILALQLLARTGEFDRNRDWHHIGQMMNVSPESQTDWHRQSLFFQLVNQVRPSTFDYWNIQTPSMLLAEVAPLLRFNDYSGDEERLGLLEAMSERARDASLTFIQRFEVFSLMTDRNLQRWYAIHFDAQEREGRSFDGSPLASAFVDALRDCYDLVFRIDDVDWRDFSSRVQQIERVRNRVESHYNATNLIDLEDVARAPIASLAATGKKLPSSANGPTAESVLEELKKLTSPETVARLLYHGCDASSKDPSYYDYLLDNRMTARYSPSQDERPDQIRDLVVALENPGAVARPIVRSAMSDLISYEETRFVNARRAKDLRYDIGKLRLSLSAVSTWLQNWWTEGHYRHASEYVRLHDNGSTARRHFDLDPMKQFLHRGIMADVILLYGKRPSPLRECERALDRLMHTIRMPNYMFDSNPVSVAGFSGVLKAISTYNAMQRLWKKQGRDTA